MLDPLHLHVRNDFYSYLVPWTASIVSSPESCENIIEQSTGGVMLRDGLLNLRSEGGFHDEFPAYITEMTRNYE